MPRSLAALGIGLLLTAPCIAVIGIRAAAGKYAGGAWLLLAGWRGRDGPR